MKLTKEELIKKVTDMEIDDSVKMELLEDVSDSFEESEERIDPAEFERISTELEEAKKGYDDLKEKYIRRFSEADKDDPDETLEEEEKEEVIDIKEI